VANERRDLCLVPWAEARGLAVRIDRRAGELEQLGENGAWGNRHLVSDCGSRERCDELFAADIAGSPELQAKIVAELSGKVLVSRCYPRRGHGDHLARLANQAQPPAGVA
jgi:hypothetical protein